VGLRLPGSHELIVLEASLVDAQRAQLSQPKVTQDGVTPTKPLEVIPDIGRPWAHDPVIVPRPHRHIKARRAARAAPRYHPARALEVSADCADAYVVLAEHSHTPEAALALYEQALAAGERALGPDVFAQEAGRFWGLVPTRPYMRARLGLAQTLEELDRNDEAIAHYRELLRLDAGDNQGVRYALLRTAQRTNRHVPRYITGDDEWPGPEPTAYAPGSREEAVSCDIELGDAW